MSFVKRRFRKKNLGERQNMKESIRSIKWYDVMNIVARDYERRKNSYNDILYMQLDLDFDIKLDTNIE